MSPFEFVWVVDSDIEDERDIPLAQNTSGNIGPVKTLAPLPEHENVNHQNDPPDDLSDGPFRQLWRRSQGRKSHEIQSVELSN